MLFRSCNRPLVVDIALATVDDGNVSKTQRNDPAGKNVDDVGALVPTRSARWSAPSLRQTPRSNAHEIHLREHSNRPRPLRIALPRHLQPIRVRKIRVGGRHGEDDRVGLHDKLEEHLADLALDIAGLISDGDLRNDRVSSSGGDAAPGNEPW